MSNFGGHSLLQQLEFIRLKNAVAAGATDITDATVVDTANRESALFIIPVGAVTDSTASSVEIHGSDASGSGFALMEDDEGNECKYTIQNADDNKVILIEVFRPRHRYLRPVFKRATQNVVVDGIMVALSGLRSEPVSATPPATVATRSRFISPKVPA